MTLVAETAGCQFTPAGVLRLPADAWPVSKPEQMLRYLQDALRRLDPAPGQGVSAPGTHRGGTGTGETTVTH